MLHLITLVTIIIQSWDLYGGKKEKNQLYSSASMAILQFKTEKLYFDNVIVTNPWSISVFRQISLDLENEIFCLWDCCEIVNVGKFNKNFYKKTQLLLVIYVDFRGTTIAKINEA